MTYEEALALWGAAFLVKQNRHLVGAVIDPGTVSVSTDFSEGYACCGGSDPLCYCSFAESPRADVTVRGALAEELTVKWGRGAFTSVQTFPKGQPLAATLPLEDFDFTTFLAELVEAGGGTVGK